MGITLREIAKKSGYGYGTVARALSDNPEKVKKETRNKILAIAKKCDYVRNINAQALSIGKSKDIALVIPAVFYSIFYNDFYIKLIAGVMESVASYGYKLRIIVLEEKRTFLEVSKDIRSLNLQGLILSSFCGDFFIKKSNIKKFNVPVVVLNKEVTGKSIHSIILDDFQGGYDGALYLIELGHKHIGYIRGETYDIEERFEGFKKAMSDNKLKIDDKIIFQGVGNQEAGYKEMVKLLKVKKRPTAIFTGNDEMAIGAIKAMKDMGLRCPEDISVIGFDDIEIINFTEPRLSTMSRPVFLMGKTAVDILLNEKINYEKKCIVFNADLAERDSCCIA